MSLLGVDVGTTGCKAGAFAEDGRLIALAYEEYSVQRPEPGWSELDAHDVWDKVQRTIRATASATAKDPVRALAVSSLGEAMAPVTADRRILGPSILNDDARGAEYLEWLGGLVSDCDLYRINGNTLGNHYSLPKLLWLREHRPGVFEKADRHLLWGSLVPYMLGADAFVDYSLANRTLLFDVDSGTWSDDILDLVGLDARKLPSAVPSGTPIGMIASRAAMDLGLPKDVMLVSGAHDQCANALGCGAVEAGNAMLGMGTYLTLAPVFAGRRDPTPMMRQGLNTEHHAFPERFVSFIYNHGGSLVKWHRDTFAARDREAPGKKGEDVYDKLFAEMPDAPSRVMVLPHFAPTGPPAFIADSCGVMAGLLLDTSRGEILKGILEGVLFYLRECVERLPEIGIEIADCRVVGGGSKSDYWVQAGADILGCSFVRPKQTEAGVLGAAIMAGAACGAYASMREAVDTLVQLERAFDPEPRMKARYDERFAKYRRLWPLMADYLRDLAAS